MENGFREQAKNLVAQMSLEEKITQLTDNSDRIERLGIPGFCWWNECLHGAARSGDATVFPQAIGMAATFDKKLIYEIGNAVSDEVRAKYNEFRTLNGDIYRYEGIAECAPNINIFRDPRWGRGHETYGEDPHLTGAIACAYIDGLQGDGKYLKVAACLKHYAVHSGPEAMRHAFSADVDDDVLYDTYLRAFEYCIRNSNIQTVMTAYNAVNGEPCCTNERLMRDILRDKFGFTGFVETDSGSINDIHEGFKITNSVVDSVARSLNAGCDLDIGGQFRNLKEAYERGLVTEERITEACENVYTTRFALGCFADDCEYDAIDYSVVRSKEHRELAKKAATDSIILLKNNGVLPIEQSKYCSIAVIGPNSNDRDVLLANYTTEPSEYTTFYKGIKDASEIPVYWEKGCNLNSNRHASHRAALNAAKRANLSILVLGLNANMEGEEGDALNDWCISGDKPSIKLPQCQMNLYHDVIALGKPVIVVNVSGSCMNLSEFAQSADALLQCFYPGELGGEALADILFGKVSPSGRLPVTFYAGEDDLPPFEDYSMKNRSYRFYEGTPLYPFGYGLSYTSFAYTDVVVDNQSVNVTVTNTGARDGADAVLLYGEKDGRFELIGFEKVELSANAAVRIAIGYEGSYKRFRVGSDLIVR